jgi:beta-glucosidase-like glycosyl hydrolase
MQDEVLLASATIWRLICPTAVASLRTEASSLMGLAHPDTASVPCSISRWLIRMIMRRQMGHCS